MKSSKTGRGSDQFPLRLPEGMRERIKAAADMNNRSMNAEIVSTLEEKYPEPEKLARTSWLVSCIIRPSVKIAAGRAIRDAAAEEGSKATDSINERLRSVDELEVQDLLRIILDLDKLGKEVPARAVELLIERGELPKYLLDREKDYIPIF